MTCGVASSRRLGLAATEIAWRVVQRRRQAAALQGASRIFIVSGCPPAGSVLNVSWPDVPSSQLVFSPNS